MITKQNWERIFAGGLVIGLILGISIGMIIQNIMINNTIKNAGESLEGVISNMNIEIDLNETKLVEATYNLFPETRPIIK